MSRESLSRRSSVLVSLGVLVLSLMALAVMPMLAQAAEGVPISGNFTVQWEGLGVLSACAPGDASCSACLNNSGIYVEAQGIGNTSQGTLFMQVLKCWYPFNGPYGTYAGTFTVTAPSGKDSLTGTYAGQNDNAGDAYGFGPFSGVLTVTGGTGKFQGAHGSIRFTAESGPATAGPSANTYVGMAFYAVRGDLELPESN